MKKPRKLWSYFFVHNGNVIGGNSVQLRLCLVRATSNKQADKAARDFPEDEGDVSEDRSDDVQWSVTRLHQVDDSVLQRYGRRTVSRVLPFHFEPSSDGRTKDKYVVIPTYRRRDGSFCLAWLKRKFLNGEVKLQYPFCLDELLSDKFLGLVENFEWDYGRRNAQQQTTEKPVDAANEAKPASVTDQLRALKAQLATSKRTHKSKVAPGPLLPNMA